MRAILVDGDEISRNLFAEMVMNIHKLSLIAMFPSAEEALEYLTQNQESIELAIMDVHLPKMNGLELAKQLQQMYSGIMIIFETGSVDYAIEALRIKVAGYIIKPYDRKEIDYAIESAYLLSKRRDSKIYARTFGHFDLFVDGEPVVFKSAKAKELLALLIDRQGGIVTSEQVISVLWEERPNDDATQNLASKISKTLKRELDSAGIGDIINIGRGILNLNVGSIECDLYEFLEGRVNAERQYYGEYMSDYFWGENRVYALNRLINERK